MSSRLALGVQNTSFKRHEPFWGLRSPTSYPSRTRILAHDRQHCRCRAPAHLPRTGGSSDGKSGVDHPYEPRGPFDPARPLYPNLYGCSFARGPRRRSGPSRPPESLNHASQFAWSRRRLGLVELEWRDGAPPQLKLQSQSLHPGVGGQEYRPPRSNAADAAGQSEPNFQICHLVSLDQAKGIQRPSETISQGNKAVYRKSKNPKTQEVNNSYQNIPIWGNDKYISIDHQVFAITTPYI